MGGACIASIDDVSAIYWNPALLSRIEKYQMLIDCYLSIESEKDNSSKSDFNVYYLNTYLLVSNIAVVFPTKIGKLGFSISTPEINDQMSFIEHNLPNQERTSTKLSFAYSNYLYNKLNIGINLAYYFNRFEYVGIFELLDLKDHAYHYNSIGYDVGISCELFKELLNLGLVYQSSVNISTLLWLPQKNQLDWENVSMGFAIYLNKCYTLGLKVGYFHWGNNEFYYPISLGIIKKTTKYDFSFGYSQFEQPNNNSMSDAFNTGDKYGFFYYRYIYS